MGWVVWGVVKVWVGVDRDRRRYCGAEVEIVIRQNDERWDYELMEETKGGIDGRENENFAGDLEAHEEDLRWSGAMAERVEDDSYEDGWMLLMHQVVEGGRD